MVWITPPPFPRKKDWNYHYQCQNFHHKYVFFSLVFFFIIRASCCSSSRTWHSSHKTAMSAFHLSLPLHPNQLLAQAQFQPAVSPPSWGQGAVLAHLTFRKCVAFAAPPPPPWEEERKQNGEVVLASGASVLHSIRLRDSSSWPHAFYCLCLKHNPASSLDRGKTTKKHKYLSPWLDQIKIPWDISIWSWVKFGVEKLLHFKNTIFKFNIQGFQCFYFRRNTTMYKTNYWFMHLSYL